MMNSIFQELLYKGVLANYMDDFVILAKTMKELKKQMIRFLKIVEKHNLCFKRSKCDFNMEEIPILGVIVGKEHGTRQGQGSQRMENINENQRSKKLLSFYQRFIQNFSHIAKLLNNLKEKKKWKWKEEHQ